MITEDAPLHRDDGSGWYETDKDSILGFSQLLKPQRDPLVSSNIEIDDKNPIVNRKYVHLKGSVL